MSREKEVKVCMNLEKEPDIKELEAFWISCMKRILAEQKVSAEKEKKRKVND